MYDKNAYEEYIATANLVENKETKKYVCPLCQKEYSLYGIKNHIRHHFGYEGSFSKANGCTAWNKGLTKETSETVRRCGQVYHERCKQGKIVPYYKGKHLSEEMKAKISESMKLAHKEGRAHNIGMSRWNNTPSYPEQFIMEVIKNEIDDKNYVRECPFHKYSFDFAWMHKKKYLEIDGDQHQRFEEYHQRDMEKDALAASEGWTGLRLAWKDIFNDTKTYIAKIKSFVDE